MIRWEHTMTWIEVLSPEGRPAPSAAGGTARLAGLNGVTIGLHDNAKPGAVELLTAIGSGLTGQGAQLRSWSKAHAARPSPHIAELSAHVAGAVFALGD